MSDVLPIFWPEVNAEDNILVSLEGVQTWEQKLDAILKFHKCVNEAVTRLKVVLGKAG